MPKPNLQNEKLLNFANESASLPPPASLGDALDSASTSTCPVHLGHASSVPSPTTGTVEPVKSLELSPISMIRSSSPPKVTPQPTFFYNKTPFGWEDHLCDPEFSSWIIKYMVPTQYYDSVQHVLKLMNNVTNLDDLALNYEFLSAEDVLKYMKSKDEFTKHLNGIIILNLIVEAIVHTKTQDLPPIQSEHVTAATTKLQELISSPLFMEIKQIYVQASHKMFMDDDNQSVASQVRSTHHNQPGISSKASTASTNVSTHVSSFQLLTNDEKQQLFQSLDDVATLFPEQINYPEVKEALIQKILKNRGGSKHQQPSFKSTSTQSSGSTLPTEVTVPTKTNSTDGGSYSYSSRSSKTRRSRAPRIKLRAKINEKIIWDGRRTTFKPLYDLISGHLYQINADYMISNNFLASYINKGNKYLKSDKFKTKFKVSYNQSKYDSKYLYGILKMVTRAGGAGKKHVHRYQTTADGFLTWKDMVEDCEHDGSTKVRIEKLMAIVNFPFHKKFNGGLMSYIERFQTSIEELGTMVSMYESLENKLEFLKTGLNREMSITENILDYIEKEHLDFNQACKYIREKALMKSNFDPDNNKKRFNKASQEDDTERTEEDEVKRIFSIMKNW